MTARLVIVSTLLLLLGSPAASAKYGASVTARTLCNPDKIARTNAWVDCLRLEISRSESALAGLITKTVAKMGTADMLDQPKRSENITLFKELQSQWLKLRDEDCKAYAAHSAGLGFGAAQFNLECVLNETVSRVRTLSTRYDIPQ